MAWHVIAVSLGTLVGVFMGFSFMIAVTSPRPDLKLLFWIFKTYLTTGGGSGVLVSLLNFWLKHELVAAATYFSALTICFMIFVTFGWRQREESKKENDRRNRDRKIDKVLLNKAEMGIEKKDELLDRDN